MNITPLPVRWTPGVRSAVLTVRMDAFLLEHADAELIVDTGKVCCTLTGHEMPAELSVVEDHWSGAKYRKASGGCGRLEKGSQAAAPAKPAVPVSAAAAAWRHKRHCGVVVAPGLLLGSKGSQQDTAYTEGITHVLCCADELQAPKRVWPQYKRLPLQERRRRDTDEQVDAMILSGVAWAVDARLAGAAVLIHCRRGLNRSAAVTCGVLMRERGIGLAEALACVKRAQRKAAPDAQLRASLCRLHARGWTSSVEQ